MGGAGELASAGLSAPAPVGVEDRLSLKAEVTGPEADDLSAPPSVQDGGQKQRPVPASCD